MDIVEAIIRLNHSKNKINEDYNDLGKRTAKRAYKRLMGYDSKPYRTLTTNDKRFLRKFAQQVIDEYLPKYIEGYLDVSYISKQLCDQSMKANISDYDIIIEALKFLKKLDRIGGLEHGLFTVNGFMKAAEQGLHNINSDERQELEDTIVNFTGGDVNDKYKDFPYYVSGYNHDAVFEPAEGGYYVDISYLANSKGFNTLEDAQKFANESAAQFEPDYERKFESNSSVRGGTDYHFRNEYVGDGVDICIEDKKSLGKKEKHYYGYS